jgi:uncharacterized protein
MEIYYIIIFFMLYSFAGWLLEIVYRSIKQKKFVNPGFLFGPFVPLYGVGALVTFISYAYISKLNVALQFLTFLMLLSVIEYITGEFFERAYGIKLWDYSNNRFNIKGKISPVFSIVWAITALLMINFIHPSIAKYIYGIEPYLAKDISIVFGLYFITDFCFSIISLNKFSRTFHNLYKKYALLSNKETVKILKSFKRILGAFPDLNKLLSDGININIKDKLNSAMGKISDISESVISVMNERKPHEEEYNNIINDILTNSEFLRLKDYFHHNSSIYEHAKIVSYITYRICKYLNLDYMSGARGSLLHDFFLYDWRHHREPELHKDKYHGLEHPAIALENSMKYFKLNEIEKDIIIKHMWPLTITPPRYYESFIVTFVDKYVSSMEFINEYKKRAFNIKFPKKPGKNCDE